MQQFLFEQEDDEEYYLVSAATEEEAKKKLAEYLDLESLGTTVDEMFDLKEFDVIA